MRCRSQLTIQCCIWPSTYNVCGWCLLRLSTAISCAEHQYKHNWVMIIKWWCFVNTSVSTSPSSACIDVLHNWAPYLFSVHINHKLWVCPVKCSSEQWAGICSDLFWTSCLSKQSQVVCMRPNYIKLPYMLALLLCTSEHCIWTGRICCGCSAHQSQGLSVSPNQAVTEGLSSRFHHQLMIFCEQNVSVRSHHTQHVSLAVLFCTSERCTLFQSTSVLCVESDEAVLGEIWSAYWWCFFSILTCACVAVMHIWALYLDWAHMLWLQCTSVTWSVSSDEATIDDLGCAACSSSTHHVLRACCLSQQSPYAASVTTSSSQLCLHWCSAHLSSVLPAQSRWRSGC